MACCGSRPPPKAPSAALQALIFDGDHWRLPLSVDDLGSKAAADPDHPVTFCDSEQLAAAVAHASHPKPPTAVVVFGVYSSFVRVIPAPEVYAVRWLPASTTLLVLGPQGLARLVLDPASPASSRRLELDWVELPSAIGRLPPSSMDLVPTPGLSAALILQRQHDTSEHIMLSLTLVDTCTLGELGSRSYEVLPPREGEHSGDRDRECSVHCTRAAAAVCLGVQGGVVYQLDTASGQPGRCLFRNELLQQPAFSHCGHMLAGISGEDSIVVLSRQTGSTLATLSRDNIWAELDETWEPLSVIWTPSGRLLVVSCVDDELLDSEGNEMEVYDDCSDTSSQQPTQTVVFSEATFV